MAEPSIALDSGATSSTSLGTKLCLCMLFLDIVFILSAIAFTTTIQQHLATFVQAFAAVSALVLACIGALFKWDRLQLRDLVRFIEVHWRVRVAIGVVTLVFFGVIAVTVVGRPPVLPLGPRTGTIVGHVPINIRTKPGIAGTKIASLRPGQSVVVTGITVTSDGLPWYHVSVPGKYPDAWMASRIDDNGEVYNAVAFSGN